jgi:hypothetical protein
MSSIDSKVKALRTATHRHHLLAQECKHGQGADRHIQALFRLARIHQQKLPGYQFPELFRHYSYHKTSKFFKLITSFSDLCN